MQIDSLRDFIALSSTLNFTVVSAELNMTQPALSNHIKALEQEMGVALIKRGTVNSRAELTQAGKVVLEQSQLLIRQYDFMVNQARLAQSGITGKVRVQLLRFENASSLISLTQAFQEQYPGIEVKYEPWTIDDIVGDLHNDVIDCGACFGLVDTSAHDFGEYGPIEFIPYGTNTLVFIIDENDPLAGESSVSFEDVKGYTMIMPANIRPLMNEYRIRSLFESQGATPLLKKKYFRSYEDLTLNELEPGEVTLGDLSYKDTSLANLSGRNRFFEAEPAIKLYNCLAFREDDESESVNAFKDYVRGLGIK